MKCILLFNLPSNYKNTFSLINIPVLLMNEDDKFQQLGYLIKKENYLHLNAKGKSFKEPMIIFNELSDNELDNVLGLVRNNSIKVKHKAIVTKYNLDWTVNSLFVELDKERKAIEEKRR